MVPRPPVTRAARVCSLGALGALVALVVLAGCGADPAVRAAARGDLPALHQQLDQRAADGKLDEGTVRDVARAVLEHDVARYEGSEGARRVEALGGCASPLKGSLRRLSEGDDDAAASAAMLLLETDAVDVDAWADARRDDPNPRWRAVATRGSIGPGDAALRAARAHDDDRRVRRAAIDAAGMAGCASDFPLLLEAARHDPETITRVDAVRMLARASVRLEGDALRAELVDRLHDLWAAGDEPLRGAIARAWAAPALVSLGGARDLQAIVTGVDAAGEGHVAVEAAAALMSTGSVDGEARLVTLAEHGDAAVRAHALRLLDPTRPAHLDALHAAMQPAAQGPDASDAREVAAESVARLPRSIADGLPRPGGVDVHAEALATLSALAALPDRTGTDAAIALAELGDDSVRARLVGELGTRSPLRARAAGALTRLGHAGDARALLWADDLDVRDAAACALLGPR